MRSPTLWYRIAAIAYAIFTFGHTAGAASGAIRGPEEEAVLKQLGAYTFDVMGATRSHLDFYEGLGWLLSLNLMLLTVLCWQLGALHRANRLWAMRLGAAVCLATFGIAWLSWRDFFIAPAMLSTAAALALVVAVARGLAEEAVAG
ncbi:MAG: hypothetical protein P3A28_08330 [Gemmatimonadota bacterium]|nr:hypothetical protein [Gemmatimonadota bacterium]